MLDVIVFGTGNYLQKYKKYLENNASGVAEPSTYPGSEMAQDAFSVR